MRAKLLCCVMIATVMSGRAHANQILSICNKGDAVLNEPKPVTSVPVQ
jgi:hypothetical protein